MNKDMLILPLQFFAEGETTAEASSDTENMSNETTAPKNFTQSEVDAAISRAIDSYAKKKDKEFERLLNKAKEDGVVKGKSYAELTEEERKARDLEERENKLAQKERELTLRERTATLKTDLTTAGLPEVFAELLVKEEDDAKVQRYIADIKKELDKAVNEKVKSNLRQSPPKTDSAEASANGAEKSWGERIAEQEAKKAQSAVYDPWATK